MSLCANVSELARELRMAAGTVLSIVGSRLEATERARVDEVGPQWLNEFEEKREVIEPGYDLEALFDERARRYESSLTSTLTVRCGRCPAEFTGDSALATLYRHLADQHPDSSAAVSAAADPSPADNHHASRGAGDEGPEGASAIPPAAPSGHPPLNVACCDCDPCSCWHHQVREDDLAAHIMGDFVSGQEVDALTATLIDALSSRIASALLTDFTITRRA